MELTIKKSALSESLKSIAGAVKTYVLIEVKGKISLSATNGIISIMSTVDADIKKEGEVYVEYSRLEGFAKNYAGDTITMKSTKAGWLNIEGENIKMRLPGSKEAKPIIEFKPLDNIIKTSYTEFKNAINMTEFAIGQNAAREGLLGLSIDVQNDKILFSGADGHMIARYQSDNKSEYTGKVLVPRRTAIEIGKIIDKDSVLSVGDSQIQVSSDTLKFKSNLLEANFPDLNRLVDGDNPNKIKVRKDALTNFINILSSVASVEKDPIVKFVFGDKKIQLISKKVDTGDGDAVIECDYKGSEISIGINIQFLKNTIAAFSQIDDEHVVFNIKDSNTAIILNSDTLLNYRAAIMPVRILW